MNFKTSLLAALAVAALLAAPALAQPTPQDATWTIPGFKFHTGETLAEMKVHYLTLGSPSSPAVLVLHGTGGNGAKVMANGQKITNYKGLMGTYTYTATNREGLTASSIRWQTVRGGKLGPL